MLGNLSLKSHLLTVLLIAVYLSSGCYGDSGTCTPEMYGHDMAAYWACEAQFAHQSNWFPSPIAGLFSYEIWNGYDGFWQNGAVLETMVNFVAYTNHTSTRYVSVIKGGYRELYSLLEAYGPYPSFDDMGWYGLSYARIYEVLGLQEFLQTAEDIFNWAWKTGWDTSGTCDGGFWFDNLFASKQTITNAQMLQLAAKLYRLTNNTDYKTKMNKLYEYIMANDIINGTTWLVADGATENCTSNGIYDYTYNAGVMVGAMAQMFKVTNNPDYMYIGYNIANAIITKFSDPNNGILVEPCEPKCNDDALMYKGIFVRNLRYLLDEGQRIMEKAFMEWLDLQVNSNVKKNICLKDPISLCNITFQDGPPYFNKSGPVFGQDWRGPFTVGNPMHQTSVLDLFTSAIHLGTTCTGEYCNYDPKTPAPQPLTCGDHPCPQNEDCCEYSPYTTYTCCAVGQHCNTTSGICV